MDMFNKITNCAETFAQCFYEPRDEENRTLIRQIDKIKKTNFVVEKMFYLKQLITRLFTMINSTEVRLFNRTNPPLTPFVYIFNSKQCEGKMRKQQFVVYNRGKKAHSRPGICFVKDSYKNFKKNLQIISP